MRSFLSQQSILGHDRVGQYREKLCRDTINLFREIVGQAGKFFFTIEYF